MEHFKEAKNQLKNITISEIKKLLNDNYPLEYSKMIIEDEAKIDRVDYYYSELNYIKSERNLFLISFPLFDNIKDDFKIFEGGIPKFGEKAVVEFDNYIEEFNQIPGAKEITIPPKGYKSVFDFPFDTIGNEINENQRFYFIPKETYQETCTHCKGNKFITCSNHECSGKHTWRCKKCIGKGRVTCNKCSGNGSNRCSSCSGSGKKSTHVNGKPKLERCTKCIGEGKLPCTPCQKSGEIRCATCEGDGNITCQICYADKGRYGMIDCPQCLTAGKVARFMYVETQIDSLKSNQLIKTGNSFDVNNDIIKNHVIGHKSPVLIYKKLNGEALNNSDDISSPLIKKYESDLGISKNAYPLLVQAEIFYQVIPCIQISYKHILTNEIHQLKVVDIWNFPEVIFPTNAEATKISIGSITKAIKTVMSKFLKTEGYKQKEDKKLEFKLLIYLAKSDGKIEEGEKTELSKKISCLKEFTNKEKKDLFNLLNSESLPELTREHVIFNNPEKGQEILTSLEELAMADDNYCTTEKELIIKIKEYVSANPLTEKLKT